MVFGLFKKKNNTENNGDETPPNQFPETKIPAVFSKIDSDVKLIHQWIFHLSSKSQDIDAKHKLHFEIAKKDINNLNLWISFLNQHTQELKTQVHETQKQLAKFEEHHSKLLERIDALEQKNQITEQITRGNKKITPQLQTDTGFIENYVSSNDAVNAVIAKSPLTSSEKKVINSLLNAQKAMDYNTLSKITALNYGTVKNIICSLRRKGIKINNSVNPYGEKEFFLNEESKIELTGR